MLVSSRVFGLLIQPHDIVQPRDLSLQNDDVVGDESQRVVDSGPRRPPSGPGWPFACWSIVPALALDPDASFAGGVGQIEFSKRLGEIRICLAQAGVRSSTLISSSSWAFCSAAPAFSIC